MRPSSTLMMARMARSFLRVTRKLDAPLPKRWTLPSARVTSKGTEVLANRPAKRPSGECRSTPVEARRAARSSPASIFWLMRRLLIDRAQIRLAISIRPGEAKGILPSGLIRRYFRFGWLRELPQLPFQTLYFEDLSVGMRESYSKTVKSSDVVGFAELTGDRNPIHLS